MATSASPAANGQQLHATGSEEARLRRHRREHRRATRLLRGLAILDPRFRRLGGDPVASALARRFGLRSWDLVIAAATIGDRCLTVLMAPTRVWHRHRRSLLRLKRCLLTVGRCLLLPEKSLRRRIEAATKNNARRSAIGIPAPQRPAPGARHDRF